MDTSFLTQQVTSIIGQLHNLFDEIGVPHHERDSRESELFASLSETLHNHLRVVSSEKNELIEEGQRIITTIKQMEASLEDYKSNNNFYAPKNEQIKITYPLIECVQSLKEKHKTISKLHQERFEQVKKLIQALESYSSHLEPSFIKIKLPPVAADGTVPPSFDLSPSYINSVDVEFTRVYEEYTKRVALVGQLGEEIVKLWAELGTPQAQTDTSIVRCWRESPEQLGLHQEDLNNLKSRRDKLNEEKRARERRLKELRLTIEALWERLNIEEPERKAFSIKSRGCGLKTINDLEDELARLNELKRQNLHLFVEDARTKLQVLWDELYISEEEAIDFTPMFCDVFSDALLSAHEAEIGRLEALKEQRAPMLQLIARHRSLISEREELNASSQDGSRLMLKPQKGEKRDPGKLLREEKMRKRIAKELPKVEQELLNILEKWEDEYGRPMLVFGERYIDIIAEASAAAKPAPSRAKTPNGLPPRAKTPVSSASLAGHASGTIKSASKTAPSTIKSASSRQLGISRPKTPVESVARAPAPAKSSNNLRSPGKSPSKIPARIPLSNMPGGNNSPERAAAGPRPRADDAAGTQRKMGPPLMAPPPKMRDLFAPVSNSHREDFEDIHRSGSVVRSVVPEDPYQTLPHPKYNQARPLPQQGNHVPAQNQNYMYHSEMPPPPRPVYNSASSYTGTASSAPSTASRQTSITSSVNTAASSAPTTCSSSENWETYGDECSPPGSDRSVNPHYLPDSSRQQHVASGLNNKRYAQDEMSSTTRKLKTYNGSATIIGPAETMMSRGQVIVSGSEAGWTDDNETY